VCGQKSIMDMTDKAAILDLSQDDLKKLVADWGEPAYRAAQIEQWLYRQHITDPLQMTSLPKRLRQRLADECRVDPLSPLVSLDSTDGHTHKTLFALPDGREIEAVLMRYERRQTLCISTQVGCAMDCPFCATGQMGFMRNLTAGEIVAQVLYYARHLGRQEKWVTNIVFMGMGEPLANYAETWRAIRRLNDSQGFNLGARNMTLSTVGLVPAIRRVSKSRSRWGWPSRCTRPPMRYATKLSPSTGATRWPCLWKPCAIIFGRRAGESPLNMR